MKSKDQVLLEAAVDKIIFKEDLMNTSTSTFDEPAMRPSPTERPNYAPESTFDWTGSDKEDKKDGNFYDQTKEELIANIIEIEKQIQQEASKKTLNVREVDQFLKELHNILNLEIEKVRVKLKDASNRG